MRVRTFQTPRFAKLYAIMGMNIILHRGNKTMERKSDRHCAECNGKGSVIDKVDHDAYRKVPCDCVPYEGKPILPDADAYFDLVPT